MAGQPGNTSDCPVCFRRGSEEVPWPRSGLAEAGYRRIRCGAAVGHRIFKADSAVWIVDNNRSIGGVAVAVAGLFAAVASAEETNMDRKAESQTVEWIVDNTQSIGGLAVTVQGAPKVIEGEKGKVVLFNGESDGLFFNANPIKGAVAFTIEALFWPDPDGRPEQRFVHVQENGTANRVLLETRLAGGSWYGDTYIRSGSTDSALNDPKLLHPLGQWHTLAVVFDGTNMIQYLNGKRELSRGIDFAPMGDAKVSIGCRINSVQWFKGAVRAVRFTPSALAPERLLRP